MAKHRLDLQKLNQLGQGAALISPTDTTTENTEKQKHPGGRPKKEKKASRVFNIHFYEDDFDQLSLNAAHQGIPIATFIKTLIKQGGGFDPIQ